MHTIKTAKSYTAQSESQEDSSFPADRHKAILNKKDQEVKNKRKSDKQLQIRINHISSTALEKVSNKLLGVARGGGGGALKPVLRVHKLFGPR